MKKVPYRKPALLSSPGLSGCPMSVSSHCAMSGWRTHIALTSPQYAPLNCGRHGKRTTSGAIGTLIDQNRAAARRLYGSRIAAGDRRVSRYAQGRSTCESKTSLRGRGRRLPLASGGPCGGLPTTPQVQGAATPDEPPASVTLKLAPGLPKALSVTPLLPGRRPWGRVIPRPPSLSIWRKQQ